MYKNLGIHWASSIPAFLALACVPFPFLFYKYGEKIRMKCKYAAEAADALERMRARSDDEDDMIEDGEETEIDGDVLNEKKEEVSEGGVVGEKRKRVTSSDGHAAEEGSARQTT